MKQRVLAILLFLLPIVSCGRDYRVSQTSAEYAGIKPEILISVSPTRQSPHSKEYSPQIRVFNSAPKPLTITSIDFVASGVTYHSTHTLGVLDVVGAKSEAVLPAHFELNTEIGTALSQPGELHFRYRGAQDGLAKVIVEGK